MTKHVLLYGLLGGLLIALLKAVEYRFLVVEYSVEILGLIAQALSNREIAEKLFVSENTVKPHSSRLFDKLGGRSGARWRSRPSNTRSRW